MKSILFLFGDAAGYFAMLSLLFPIIASIVVRKKKIELTNEMKLFEVLIYLTFMGQIISHSSWFELNTYKDFTLAFYLPFHTAVLSYFLIKWTFKFKNELQIAIGITALSIIINLFLSDFSLSTEKMLWFDTFILLSLSVFLSYSRDKNGVRLKCEYNFIHNGIYVGALLTVLGIALPKLDIIFFGLFIHTLANIACNIYFARSFTCLSR